MYVAYICIIVYVQLCIVYVQLCIVYVHVSKHGRTAHPQPNELTDFVFDRYDMPQDNCSLWLTSANHSDSMNVVPCEEWVYDKSVMRNTIVTDFSLVCGATWSGYVSQSIFMVGVLLGNILIGYVSDR